MAFVWAATVALATGIALGAALPTQLRTTKAFSVQQVANPHYVRDGPSALLKAYLKYGATPPGSLVRAAGQGSVVATPDMTDVCIPPGFVVFNSGRCCLHIRSIPTLEIQVLDSC